MSDSVFFDTNLLVYSYEKKSDRKCTVCRDFVLDCFARKVHLAVSNQVLAEFFSVITTKSESPLTIGEAKKLILLITSSSAWDKLNYTTQTVIRAAALSDEHGLSIWDAFIAATMLEHGITTIYTENEKDFKKMPGITVINPLKHQT